MAALPDMTIGALAARSGVSTATLRFYETLGLISSTRTGGNQRRYARQVLRRVAVIRAAQGVGMSLAQVKTALANLPEGRTPDEADWRELSRSWRRQLDDRIAELVRLRDGLASCIGCGCLSLRKCLLLNPADRIARTGAGARYLAGDSPRTRYRRMRIQAP
ncbi:MAG: redox-sensitive transcriptional activator SoxR [Chloroflexi bacterium]|nr:redox-sensitive transcriptional activator SoxR [Chloroflexota bacterium]